MKKRAQIWYMDFIIGLTIFILMLVVAFKFTTLKFSDDESDRARIWDDAQRLTGAILSSGIPENWTQSNAISIGITSDSSALDIVKLDLLKNFTLSNYDRTKFIFGINSDYLLHFETINNTLLNITDNPYIGKPGLTDQDVLDNNPKDKLAFVRYLVYRHDSIAEIIAMKILVWRE